MVQAVDKLHVPGAIAERCQSPDVYDTVRVACEDELAFDPFVAGAIVEGAAEHLILRLADFLLDEKMAVEGVKEDVGSPAEDDVAACATDLRSLDGMS